MVSSEFGFVSVAASVLFWGTFAVPSRGKSIQRVGVDPFVISALLGLVVFLTGWLSLAGYEWEWTNWGLLGAALWTPTSYLSLLAVKMIGLSIAQAIWAGASILVSFFWGAVIFGDSLVSLWGCLGGLSLLCIGIAGIALCKSTPSDGAVNEATALKEDRVEWPMDLNDDDPSFFDKTSSLQDRGSFRSHADETDKQNLVVNLGFRTHEGTMSQRKRYLIGYISVILVGLFNGSCMAPARYNDNSTPTYLISFGVGVLFMNLILFNAYFGLYKRSYPPLEHWRVAFLPGLGVGIMWQLGNVFALYASISPLGLTIGFPLTQCALLVSGLWGLFYFKELKGALSIAQFFISACVLLAGAALLSIYGKSE